jgi:hypothetical protein
MIEREKIMFFDLFHYLGRQSSNNNIKSTRSNNVTTTIFTTISA